MRLKDSEKKAIVDAIKVEDPEASIYLFGSRADDDQLGGDIDILVISSSIDFDGKLCIKKKIFESVEEQKIDLVIIDDPNDPFAKMALEKGIRLS